MRHPNTRQIAIIHPHKVGASQKRDTMATRKKADTPETTEPPAETGTVQIVEVQANSFDIEEAGLLEAIKPTQGRKRVDSRYLDDVRLAHETGKARGVTIPQGMKGTQVVSELHKAGVQLGLKLQTWNKEKEATPFVAFRVKGKREADSPETGDK